MAELHLEFLSLEEGCTGMSESTLVKMPHCWKSHASAHMYYVFEFQILKNYRVESHQKDLKLVKGITYTPVEPMKMRFIHR